MDGNRQSLQILASGELETVEEFRKIVVPYRNGAPVRVAELAEVIKIDSVQDTHLTGS